MKIFNEMELYMKENRNEAEIAVSSFQKDAFPSVETTPRVQGQFVPPLGKNLTAPTNIGKVQHSPPKTSQRVKFEDDSNASENSKRGFETKRPSADVRGGVHRPSVQIIS